MCVCVYDCSKKYGTFALIFVDIFFIIFTWVLYFLKGCSFPYILQKKNESRSDGSRIKACQTLWGSKSKVAATQFPNPSCPGS